MPLNTVYIILGIVVFAIVFDLSKELIKMKWGKKHL